MKNTNANHSGCYGICGGCGDDCYVYNDGGCPIADELYDIYKERGNEELKHYLDLYGHLLDIEPCIHEEGCTPLNGWIICRKCGTDIREIK